MTTLDSPLHPLYGIDDMDWSQWQTAYGDATDTQWNLKRLVSSKIRKTKEDALFKIRVSVYHQGGNYSAIPITLYYLIRILKADYLQNKLELELLSLITMPIQNCNRKKPQSLIEVLLYSQHSE
jgi:hypothetical protein